jgi:hypothetical protein
MISKIEIDFMLVNWLFIEEGEKVMSDGRERRRWGRDG